MYIYLQRERENLRKSSSEEDIAELYGLRTTSYLLENSFIEMPTRRKNKNYTFMTAPRTRL